jgi:hypothetical protein
MGNPDSDVQTTIRSFLKRAKKSETFELDTPLYADGIGLDSLETAELSAVLEDTQGTDPFSAGPMPQTIGDIVRFYDAAVAEV